MRAGRAGGVAGAVLVGTAGALSGCAGLAVPSPPSTPATATTSTATAAATTATVSSPAARLAQADATHEYPSSHPPAQRASNAAPSPVEAIRVFATAYINWTAHTVAADMRVLGAVSIGQARSAMQLAAANTAQDYELRRGGIANSGTVEAIAALAGSSDQFVVVTRERTTATNTAAYQGLRPAWHLTLATVARLGPGRWALSGWQPEN